MAFQNCNVNKLNNSLNKLDNISYEKIDTLINEMNSNDWQSNSRTRIIDALNKIKNEYKTIQNKVKNYKQASVYIEEYQELESDYNSDRKKADKYKDKLNDCNENDIAYYNNKINQYNSSVSSKKQKMNDLMQKISNLVNG